VSMTSANVSTTSTTVSTCHRWPIEEGGVVTEALVTEHPPEGQDPTTVQDSDHLLG